MPPPVVVALYCKAYTLSLAAPTSQSEWGTWVDRASPHSRIVWGSQFPGLLHKCTWYTLNVPSLQANLRSVMWGVGCKGYPQRWWMRALRRFWREYVLECLVPFRHMMLWVREGAMHST